MKTLIAALALSPLFALAWSVAELQTVIVAAILIGAFRERHA